MLRAESITYTVNKRALVRDFSFSTCPGEFTVILGANGAGKSTLLKLLSGELKGERGNIILNGKNMTDIRDAELARQRAVLNQHHSVSIPFSVREVTLMGRYPHYTSRPASHDQRIVDETLHLCGVADLAGRSSPTLSGGEKQRVQFARVLAQVWDQPGSLLLIDEPLAALDIRYQQQFMAIAKTLAHKGFIVIAVLHEINLAAQYADRVILMKNGRKWHDGTPVEVLTKANIYDVFAVEAEVHIDNRTLRCHITLREQELPVSYALTSLGGIP